MQEDIFALHANCKWILVPRPLHNNGDISKSDYCTKYHDHGTIGHHKDRLVARGYTHIKGEYFDDTFSHVIKHTTVHVIISIAATIKWIIQ